MQHYSQYLDQDIWLQVICRLIETMLSCLIFSLKAERGFTSLAIFDMLSGLFTLLMYWSYVRFLFKDLWNEWRKMKLMIWQLLLPPRFQSLLFALPQGKSILKSRLQRLAHKDCTKRLLSLLLQGRDIPKSGPQCTAHQGTAPKDY